ncbi:MAG: flagellar biosynthesis regulator FlaF [Rhodomicrobium sp.]|nr:flagellar biosynthesis regulator FlaF [Rhodomicrobium sp.]
MYRFSYAEVLEDTPQTSRERELQALQHSIDLLQAAQEKGAASREAIEAIYFLRKLWTFFIEDLGKPGNDLPKQLRADLISIGLWLIRESDRVRQRESDNFKGLIEVSQLIADGMR